MPPDKLLNDLGWAFITERHAFSVVSFFIDATMFTCQHRRFPWFGCCPALVLEAVDHLQGRDCRVNVPRVMDNTGLAPNEIPLILKY